MNNVFYNVLPIFLIAFLGSVIRRKWLKSDEFWRGLEKLLFCILFPTVLFEHSSKVDFTSSEFFKLSAALIFANLLVSVCLVFFRYKTNYDKVQFTSIFQGSTRYNNYVFFAVGAALFGDPGLRIISAIFPYMLIVTNITAIVCFSYYLPRTGTNLTKTKSVILMLRSVAANPFIIASVAGLVFNYFDIVLNVGIAKTVESLADSALAIGMLIVGAGIKFKIKPEHFKQVMATSAVKLMLMPLVAFTFMWCMEIDGMAKTIGVLFSGMPCSASSYILSRQLGGDPETMSSTITFTAIFSIFTLSILVYILG